MMLRPDWSAVSAPEMRLNAELIVPMDPLRQRAPGAAAVLEAAFAEVAQAVHHVEVGAGGVKNAGEDGHFCGGFMRLTREIRAGAGGQRSEIAIELLAGEGEFFQADGVEQREGTRGFPHDLLQLRLVPAKPVRPPPVASRSHQRTAG